MQRLSWQIGLIFFLGQILVIFSSWRFLPPQLPLFYSRPWGETQLGTPLQLLIIPLVSLIVVAVNFFFTKVAKQEELLGKILTLSAAVFNFLGLITIVQIIRLII